MDGHADSGRARASVLLLIGVLIVATNLRAVLTAVGPVLPEIGADLTLSASAQGLLVALPLVAFATVSPVVHVLSARIGIERSVVLALVFLGVATMLRSLPTESAGNWSLWLGTFVIGGAIAVGNVLLPVVVRKDFRNRIAAVTGYYIAIQSVAGASASALAVPLAIVFGSWRVSLAIWVFLVVIAVIAWLPHLRRSRADLKDAASVSVANTEDRSIWRSRESWFVAVYFGLQSSIFYIQISWLPTIEQDIGIAPTVAGYHLAGYLILGIAANFAAPWFMGIGKTLRPALVGVGVLMFFSVGGFIVWPGVAGVWVAISGFAAGAAMVFSLSLISIKAGSGPAASKLSSMVQSIAYSGVVVALITEGFIRDAGGNGTQLLVFPALLALVQAGLGWHVGRERKSRQSIS